MISVCMCKAAHMHFKMYDCDHSFAVAHIHTHSHTTHSKTYTYSIFCILTDVSTQFNVFFRSAVFCSHFCLFRFFFQNKDLCMNVYFSLFLSITSCISYSNTLFFISEVHILYVCLLCGVLCFAFISLNWLAARFFWMNWVNGFVYHVWMYVLCIMRKSGSYYYFHFI